MTDVERWSEDAAEVMAAAKALAAYYDDGAEQAEDWIAGAVVVLNATNYQRAVETLEWLADRYATTLSGKPVRDADEVIERARLIVNRARGVAAT
jgi:hypothetical protein